MPPELPFTYDTYFRFDKTHWSNLPGVDSVEATLRMFYPKFVTPEGALHGDVANSLKTLNSSMALKKKSLTARKCFKELFRFPEKLVPGSKDLSGSDVIRRIVENYGQKIHAHGVEEEKGGMCNLLMICVTGCVTVSNSSWSLFVDGPSSISCQRHGPYYVICDTDGSADKVKDNLPFDDIQFFLVPFPKNVELIKEKLDELVRHGYLTEERGAEAKKRLIDYEGFYQYMQTKPNPRKRALEEEEEEEEVRSFLQDQHGQPQPPVLFARNDDASARSPNGPIAVAPGNPEGAVSIRLTL